MEYCFCDFDLLNEYRRVSRQYAKWTYLSLPFFFLGGIFIALQMKNPLFLIAGIACFAAYFVYVIVLGIYFSKIRRGILQRSAATMPQDETGRLRLKMIGLISGANRKNIPALLFAAVVACFVPLALTKGESIFESAYFLPVFIGMYVVLFSLFGVAMFFSMRSMRQMEETANEIQRLQMQGGKDAENKDDKGR